MATTITYTEGSARSGGTGLKRPVFIGPASGGTFTNLTPYIVSRTNQLIGSAAAGYGAGVDTAATALESLKRSVVFIPVTASIAAPTITYTSSSAGPSTRFEVTGTPYNDFQLKINVIEGGTVAAGIKVQVSLDDGLTYGNTQVVTAATYATSSISGTGCSFILSGTIATGDTFSSELVPATLSAADITAAVATIKANRAYIGTPSAIYICDTPLAVSSGSANFAALNTALIDLKNENLDCPGFVQCSPRPSATTTATKVSEGATYVSEMASTVASTGIGCVAVANGGNFSVPGSIYAPQRGLIQALAPIVETADISTEIGLPSISYLDRLRVQNTTTKSSPWYDEYADGVLYSNDTTRTVSITTSTNSAAPYVTRGWVKSASDSTYYTIPRVRIAQVAKEVLLLTALKYNLASVRTGTGGIIDPVSAAIIEADFNAALRARLVNVKNRNSQPVVTEGHVVSVIFEVDRTADTFTTETLYGTCKIVPLTTLKDIAITISLEKNLNTGATTIA